MWKGATAQKVRKQYPHAWIRWAGPPVRVWTDGGSEFEGCFAEFLQHDGSHHEVSAALSPWQNGVAERRGGMWKFGFQKLLLEHVPNSKADVEELCDHTTTAHNTLIRKDGFCPSQHVLGKNSSGCSESLPGGRQ